MYNGITRTYPIRIEVGDGSLTEVWSGDTSLDSGLQTIDDNLYEAAKIDGANSIQEFFHITLPMTSHVIFFNLIMGLISTFQYFTGAYIVSSGLGGPARSTLFYNLYLYQNAFMYNDMGYASAMAWVLFVVILILTLLLFKSSKFWVYYGGNTRS